MRRINGAFAVAATMGFALAATAADPFVSNCGGFSVAFPGNPSLSVSLQKLPAGDVPTVTFGQRIPDGVFLVRYADYPAGVAAEAGEKLVKNARQAAADEVEGKVREKDSTTLSDIPAEGFTVAHKNPATVSISRALVLGNRLFTVTVLGAANAETRQSAETFFDSFQIHADAMPLFEAGLPDGSGGFREFESGCLLGCANKRGAALRCDTYCSCVRREAAAGQSEQEFSQWLNRVRSSSLTPKEKETFEKRQAKCLALR